MTVVAVNEVDSLDSTLTDLGLSQYDAALRADGVRTWHDLRGLRAAVKKGRRSRVRQAGVVEARRKLDTAFARARLRASLRNIGVLEWVDELGGEGVVTEHDLQYVKSAADLPPCIPADAADALVAHAAAFVDPDPPGGTFSSEMKPPKKKKNQKGPMSGPLFPDRLNSPGQVKGLTPSKTWTANSPRGNPSAAAAVAAAATANSPRGNPSTKTWS
eukprot:gene27229-39026_t